MKTVYLGSEPTDPEWLLIGQFTIPNGGSAFVYRRAGSTTDDCLIVPADMTFDEAADDTELTVPHIVMQQSPSFTPVSEMPQMSLVELFEEDTAAKQAATVKMVGRRDRTPDMPGKSTYLTRRNVWNDPGSGRFIRRGFSTLKYLMSLTSDEHRMWEKAKRLDEQNSNGVVAYLKRRAGRANIGPEDALRIVEVFDGDTRFSGNVRVRDDRSGREYIVPWGDVRNVASAPAVRPQRDWDRYPLGGRSIDALAVPAVEETTVPASPVKLTTKINTLMPDLSPEQTVQFAALMTDLTGIRQDSRDRFLPMNLRSFVQGYSTRDWLDPVFTDENPDPNAVALLQAWRKTLIDHVIEKGGDGVTLHRGVVNRDTNPFVPLRTEHWSNQFNDVRPQSPDAEIAGITSWTSVKTQAKEFGSYTATQDIPLSQVLGRFGSINGEVLVVDDPLVTRALDAWPNDVDGVPAAPFGTFPERYRAAQENRAIDLMAVPEMPKVGDPGASWTQQQYFVLGQGLFDADLGDGIRSVVRQSDTLGSEVDGEIRDADGKVIGGFSRRVVPQVGEVENTSLWLLPEYQNRGIGTRFVAASVKNAESAGFEAVIVTAIGDKTRNGAYTWARAGFDWLRNPMTGDVYDALRAVTEGRVNASAADRRLAEGMVERLEGKWTAPDYPTPNDVAMLGWEEGKSDWFGRRLMMGEFSIRFPRGSIAWEGRLALSPRDNRSINLMQVPAVTWPPSRRDLKDAIAAIDLGDSGLRMEIVEFRQRYTTQAFGVFRDANGDEMGLFTLNYMEKPNELEESPYLVGRVAFEEMNVYPRHRGKGVGPRAFAGVLNVLRERGGRTVVLNAASSGDSLMYGSYVWARAGVDWDHSSSTYWTLGPLSRAGYLETRHSDVPEAMEMARRLRAVSAEDVHQNRPLPDDYPTPNDVAMLGWTPGAEDWIGRQAMTDIGANWFGSVDLTDETSFPTQRTGVGDGRVIDTLDVLRTPRVGDLGGNWTEESYHDLARQVFNADLGDGFRSVAFSSSTRWQDVSGRILDSQNRTVGEWQRVVNPRSAYIENVRMYVNSDFQGRGIGSRFVAATAENAGNLGFANMVVGAVSEPPSLNGGYAWARAGFDWVDTGGIEEGLREVINGKVTYGDRLLDVTSDEQALAREMLDRLSGDPKGPDFPTPNDVAMMGWEPGAKDWFGRRFMLGKINGSMRWTGIVRLQRSDSDSRSIDLLSTAVVPEATELNRDRDISVAESWVSASRDSWLSPGVPQVEWNGDDASIVLPTGQTITSRIRKRVAQNDFTGRRQFVGSKWITLDYSNGNGDPLYFDDKAAAKRWAENHLAERFVEADERLRREAILDRVTTEALAQAPADAKVFARLPKSSMIGGYPTPEPITIPDASMYADGDNTGFRDEFDAYINSDAPRDRVQRITEASHAALRKAGYTHVLVYRAAYAKDDPYRGVLRHEPLAYTSWSTDRDVAADYVDPGYFRARSQTPLPDDAEPRFFAAVVPIDQIVSFDLIGYRSASLGWGYDGLMDRMIRETAPNVRELNGGEVLVASSVDTADRLLVGDVRQRIDVEERSIDLMALPEPPAQPERRVVREAPQTNEPISLYEVGGAVRDDIMGINSDDVDFAVTAPSYDAMKKYLEDQGFRIFQEREEFVTIKAQPPEGHPLRERTNSADFVLARRDGPSSDGRRPDYTEPGSLEDDLQRRDFTVNAIARDVNGTLIDPHDGIADIETRTLRFVGDPKTRVREDGLRVLRGYRFLVTKGLTPDPATWEALTSPESAEMLKSVSKERVAAELTKMFSFDTVGAIQLLGSLPQATLDAIFPEGVHLAPSMKKVKGQTKDRQVDALFADTVNVAEALVTDDGRTISWQTLIREMRGVTEVVDPNDSGDVVPFAVPEPTRPVVRVPLGESGGTKVGRAVAERVFGYNATDEDGIRLTSSVNFAMNTLDGYLVDGSLQADGEQIGVFSRTLHRDGSVTFETIRLDEDARGSGWGSRFIASSLDALQREGFNRVYTTAISEPDPSWNGAYTWARTGYDWADPESAMLIGDEITAYIAETRRMARSGLSPESEARFREMAAVLSAGWTGDLPPEDFPTPNDVAMVGWTPELATRIWPGKDLLSNRSIAWDGVLRLQPPETTGSDRGIDLLRASPLDGMRLATAEDRQRLAIPPAYTDVYVSTDPNAKMVWRGVDSQGRMQRGYSAEHHENQAALKFERMKALTERIDTLDAALVRDADTDDRAAALALIRHFGMRPGSRKDTQARKQAFGATTLQARHVRQYPDTGRTTLSFVGKSGVKVTVSTRDSDIYRLIESRLAGKSGTDSLFQTTDAQLLEYLAETIGPGFLTKDFRTLKANVMALEMVSRMRRPTTMTAYRKARNKVADAVAKQLGNTRATTLKSYINPTVFGPWEDALQ